MNCSHNIRKTGGKPYQYGPFELAICGISPAKRADLAARVVALLNDNYRTALVVIRAPSPKMDSDSHLGVNLITGDGHSGLLYPSEMDDFLGPRPLLDSDIVLVESEVDTDMPKLVWVEGGEVPEYTNVVAYVYDPATCPILPSQATVVADSQHALLRSVIAEHFEAQVQNVPLYGLILAGGRSTRMASDKALLEYHGETQVKHCHDLLSPWCDQVFVSLREDQRGEVGYSQFQQIPDAFLGFGPMGGILSAQKAHPDAAWLVLACDLPFVTSATIEHLVKERNPFKLATAFTSSRDGFPEPLCAVYEPKSIFRLMHFLALGYHCPRKVLINSDTWLLTPEDPRALENVNNPHERASAVEALSSEVETPQ